MHIVQVLSWWTINIFRCDTISAYMHIYPHTQEPTHTINGKYQWRKKRETMACEFSMLSPAQVLHASFVVSQNPFMLPFFLAK